MRLLKREQTGWLRNTYTFSLTNFYPADIPQYAIFSHRWGSQEVTFGDIENGTAKSKAGYKKLEFCAEQASRDGLIYFWIDTCCIDKANNTELSEAINSMFKWYKNATKCYAYLPDVSADAEWRLAFEKSEWFERGWTLQELIAPNVVEFFSVEGTKLGDKRSLEQQISRVTGVSAEALQGKSLSEIDERQRLSWVAKRTTTIEEDNAYCLLGIFDVQMPLIYGEGQQKALARLRREIRQSVDPTSDPVEDAPWIVPFERNPHFSGREPQLAELERKLFTKDCTSKIAITGLGGVGKTQLVLELLYRTKERHKDCSIIWIPATNVEHLQQGYRTVAQQLRIPGHEDEQADVKRIVQEYLSGKNVGRWLLVFDNADDIDLWTTAQSQGRNSTEGIAQEFAIGTRRLLDCLPQSKQGCIIFTTRDKKTAVRLAQENIVVLSEMDGEAAEHLLKKSLINSELMDKVQDVKALLETLTYLPLAITQAVAYINANEITLADYVSLLVEMEYGITEILSEEFEDYGRYKNAKNPVATTWLISFEQIQHSDPLAAEYLAFMACLNPKDIPQSLLPPGPSRKKQIEAVGTLSAYSFISQRSTNATLDLHRLVQLATRNWLRKEGLLSQWIHNTVTRLADIIPNDDHENMTIWRPLLPHAIQALSSDSIGEDTVTQKARLMWNCSTCLCHDGRWDEAETLLIKLLAMAMDKGSKISDRSHACMRHLSMIYRLQGWYEKAEQLAILSVENSKTRLGIDHQETLHNMHNLALTYSDQGRWNEAEQLTSQIVDTYTKVLGIKHITTLISMASLAAIYQFQGRLEDAEMLGLRAIEGMKMELGVEHPHTLAYMANLAVLYGLQGRLEQAEELSKEVIDIQKTELGPTHPDTLSSTANLAVVYIHQDRLKEAEELSIKVFDIQKTKLGANHPHTLWTMHYLALTWKKLGQDTEAVELLRETLSGRIRVLGATHPETLDSQRMLGEWEAECSNAHTELEPGEDVT